MKKFNFFILFIIFSGCNKLHPKLAVGWKQLKIHTFKIDVPSEWGVDTAQDQEDSFIGRIVGPNLDLSFDCSDMGYANHLSEDQGEIKQCNFHTDSDRNYRYITIWPKVTGRGMTGIYISSRNSPANFQMNGNNLSAKNQMLALQAFKTIELKL